MVPLTTGTGAEDRVATSTLPAHQTETSYHILIVDDDPVNLQVLKNHLTLNNHIVTEALSGHKALTYFDEGKVFDLILLDVMMPGLTGYEVCRILRENHSQSELPVIMLTAKNRVSDLVVGLESGANDYLTKPFDSRELLARVNTMIQLKEAAKSQTDLAMFRNEMEMAREIQQSLLPQTIPKIKGLDISTRYRSMINVGGDFYDFRVHADGIGTIIADVSGHGIPAALIVSVVKMAFWFQKENLKSPDDLFKSMNEILKGNIGKEFVTASYFFIDLQQKKLITGNAGHPPLLVWKKDRNELHSLRPMGRLLGISAAPAFDTSEISLDSGDRVLIYTDGVYEAVNADRDQYGMERLQAFVTEKARLSGDEFAEKLIETVTVWSGGADKIDDDIALIVVDVE